MSVTRISDFQVKNNVNENSYLVYVENGKNYLINSTNYNSLSTKIITEQTYYLSIDDYFYYLRKSYPGNHVLYIPGSLDFIENTIYTIRNAGTGKLTISSLDLGVNINYDSSISSNVLDANTTSQLYHIGDNTWDIL